MEAVQSHEKGVTGHVLASPGEKTALSSIKEQDLTNSQIFESAQQHSPLVDKPLSMSPLT
ncbi:hypothetical protein EC973_000445, partial [Apophysomyces ossiformis]